VARQYIAYWREYPDMFVDFLQTGNDPEKKPALELKFYQRVFMRVAMRYRYVYCVYPRGYSKSFLAVLVLMVRAVLYPGAKLFTSAGGKQQAAGILSEKFDEICKLVPAFRREVDWRPGKTKV
jgi:ribonucleoside-diphosphate reductase alpha chain